MEEKKLITLEEVLAGVRTIVQADPTFVYPQQDHDDSETRCECVEVEQDEDTEYYEEQYIFDECDWHLDDDNTCRYVKWDDTPACVVGHYFYKELGMRDLANFETKAPTFILEAHGYEVEPRIQRFLNTIQSQQDQGWEWDQAYDTAVREVERYETQ